MSLSALRAFSVALWGIVALLGCKEDAKVQPTTAETSAAASMASATPALVGPYRVEAMIARNDVAKKELGADRISIEDQLRASMAGGTFVYGRWMFNFSSNKISVRLDSVFRFETGYQWGWCEGEGTALWNGQNVSVPAGVATRGQGGFVDPDRSHSGNCNSNLAPGNYTVQQDNGETHLLTERDGAQAAFVLVKDDSNPDVEARARALAGYTEK